MPWPKTGATHYHAQFGLPDKCRAIKELVVKWVLLNLIRRKRKDLAPHGYPGLSDLTLECHGQMPRPYKVIDRSYVAQE